MQAYIHTKEKKLDGSYDSYQTISAECKASPLWWQLQGLSYTASGYGSRIPTRYMVKFNNRWRRVYCAIYSNNGSLFIGKKFTPELTVQITDISC